MFGWLQRRTPANRKKDQTPEDIALAKRRAELADIQLGVQERQIKVETIRRVAESETDPVTALEVISVATHRGRLPPTLYTRRKPEESPLEKLAMGMLESRLKEDPTDALERMIERRERLEEAADRLAGTHGRGDADTGNTLVDVARALANSPLGEAVGAVLGGAVQQGAQRSVVQQQTAASDTLSPALAASAGPASDEVAPAHVSTPTSEGPRPVSFRVGVMLRTLKAMNSSQAARFLLNMADQHEQVSELVGPFVSAEPDQVTMVLDAFLAEAHNGADPQVLEWAPVAAYFRDSLEWTLACHAEMRALLHEDDGADQLAVAE